MFVILLKLVMAQHIPAQQIRSNFHLSHVVLQQENAILQKHAMELLQHALQILLGWILTNQAAPARNAMALELPQALCRETVLNVAVVEEFKTCEEVGLAHLCKSDRATCAAEEAKS